MKTITIKLTAPLQSYGDEASFNLRTSYAYPSKSAIIGMVAAAFGYRREETDKISQLNSLKYAVRIEQAGSMMNEFQIAEYHKNANTTSKKLTYRNFLQDAVFIAAIGGEKSQIDKIEFALKHPKFQLYLGRRSNPPAGLLEIETFENENPLQVLENLEWKAAKWYQKKYHQAIYHTHITGDADLFDTDNIHLVKDSFGSFDSKNRFHNYRKVATKMIELENPCAEEDLTDNELDFWKFI